MRNLFKTTVKKMVIVCTAVCALCLMTGFKAAAQVNTYGTGYPQFVGSFLQAGPTPCFIYTNSAASQVLAGNVTITGALTVQGGQTNSAALNRVANPLTTGGFFTNTAQSVFLKINYVTTNTANAWFTNVTTTDVTLIGGLTGAGTNYGVATFRVGPNEVVCFTNQSGVVNLLSSESRN